MRIKNPVASLLIMSTIVLIMSNTPTSLQLLFGSKTRVDVLVLLLTHPDEQFYVRQIAEIIAQSPTPVLRELAKFEQLGLVTSEHRAHAKYWTVNTKCALYPELHSLILKTVGVGDAIRAHLGSFSSLKFAFMYGSFASGEVSPTSDVDLMLVGTVPLADLTRAIKEIEQRLRREVQYSIFSEDEFLKRITEKNNFVMNIINSPKIMLIGGDDEFGRFIAQRPD